MFKLAYYEANSHNAWDSRRDWTTLSLLYAILPYIFARDCFHDSTRDLEVT